VQEEVEGAVDQGEATRENGRRQSQANAARVNAIEGPLAAAQMPEIPPDANHHTQLI
ncbi:MAG: hypothetical protein TREMPRED_001589, partial [Tremellales sp. Tagirdzhanova-0007]